MEGARLGRRAASALDDDRRGKRANTAEMACVPTALAKDASSASGHDCEVEILWTGDWIVGNRRLAEKLFPAIAASPLFGNDASITMNLYRCANMGPFKGSLRVLFRHVKGMCYQAFVRETIAEARKSAGVDPSVHFTMSFL